MDGHAVFRWNPALWLLVAGGIGTFYAHTILAPGVGYDGSMLTMVVLFLGLGSISVAFWGFFRVHDARAERRSGVRPGRSSGTGRTSRRGNGRVGRMTDEAPVQDPTADPTLKELAAQLAERREDALGMGGPDLVERQHSLGKLTVRERLDAAVRPGHVQSRPGCTPARSTARSRPASARPPTAW